jgi:hypothetical protein
MGTKTEIKKASSFVDDLPTHMGIILMTALTAFSSLDLSVNHIRSQVALPNRPVLALQLENNEINSIRRERDETAPHYISYSETQRTPSRSAKH